DEKNPELVRIVTIFAGDKFWEEFEHEVANTPCQQALASGRCSYADNVQSAFPLDPWLSQMGIQSYLGVALVGSTGQPLGVLCVMNRTALKNANSAETILNIFASRASAELERRHWERALRESEIRNRAILSALPDLIFVLDRHGLILDFYA